MSRIQTRTYDHTDVGGIVWTETIETINREGSATRLHVVDSEQVWLDTDIGDRDGLCIGCGVSREAAIEDAIMELRDRIADLEAARGLG